MSSRFERGLSALVLALATAQVGVIGASVSGARLSPLLAWIILAASGLMGGVGARCCCGSSRPASPAPEPAGPARWHIVGASAWLAAIGLGLIIVTAHLPDLTCDGNAYHIPTIHFWACAGRIVWIDLPGCPDLPFVNGYPKGTEAIAFLIATAFGTGRWINATNLLFLPVGMLALAACCRTLGVSRRLSLLAGCAWFAVPVNAFQAATSYCDSAFASCALSWLALTFLLAAPAARRERIGWPLTIAWGAALGLTISAKGSGLILAGVGVPALAAFLLAFRRRRELALLATIGLAVAVLIGGFWYSRNWLMTGSPFYPVGLSLGDHVIFPGKSVSASIDALRNTPAEIRGLAWPWQVTRAWTQSLPDGWPASIAGVDAHLGGLGFLWVLGCVPALVWLLSSSRRNQPTERAVRSALLLLAAIVLLAFLATPLRWWARYTCWIYAAGIPPLAWLAQGSASKPGFLRRCWFGTLLAIVLGEMAATGWMLSMEYSRFQQLAPNARQSQPQRALVAMFPEAEGSVLERLCASREGVACGPLTGQSPTIGSFRSAIIGPFCQPPGMRLIRTVTPDLTAGEWQRLSRDGIRHLIWNRDCPPPPIVARTGARVETIGGFLVFHLP